MAERLFLFLWFLFVVWWIAPIWSGQKARSDQSALVALSAFALLSVSDLAFLLSLFNRAFESLFESWRGSPTGYFVPIVGIPLVIFLLRWKTHQGHTRIIQLGETVRDAAIASVILLIPFFLYHLLYGVPRTIYAKAAAVTLPLHISPPTLVAYWDQNFPPRYIEPHKNLVNEYPYPWLRWAFYGHENVGSFQLHLAVRDYPRTKADVRGIASESWLEHVHITVDTPVAVNPNEAGWWSCRVIDREESIWNNADGNDKPLGMIPVNNGMALLEVVASAKNGRWLGKVIIRRGAEDQWEEFVSGHVTYGEHVSYPMSVSEKHKDSILVNYKEGAKEADTFSNDQLIKYGLPVKRLVAADLKSICGSATWTYKLHFGPTKKLVINDPFGEAEKPVATPSPTIPPP